MTRGPGHPFIGHGLWARSYGVPRFFVLLFMVPALSFRVGETVAFRVRLMLGFKDRNPF